MRDDGVERRSAVALVLEDGAHLAPLYLRKPCHLVLLAGALLEDVLALALGGEEGAETHGHRPAEKLGEAREEHDPRGGGGAVDAGNHREGGDQAVVGAENEIPDVLPARDVPRLRVRRPILASLQEEPGQAQRQGNTSSIVCSGLRPTAFRPSPGKARSSCLRRRIATPSAR